MKKYPDDALPSVAIQFVCFTVLFVTWTLGDIFWKHGPTGISGALPVPFVERPFLLLDTDQHNGRCTEF